MTLEWLGRYYELIEQIIFMANGYSGIRSREIFTTNPPCSPEQIQVLQYLLAHENEQPIMKSIALELGMTKSAFTKLVAKLEANGLVEKYHTESNRKNIVLRASAKGRSLYEQYAVFFGKRIFDGFFAMGDKLPQTAIDQFSAMMRELNRNYNFSKPYEVDLQEPPIKLEQAGMK